MKLPDIYFIIIKKKALLNNKSALFSIDLRYDY